MSGPRGPFDDDDWWKDEPDEQEAIGGEDVETPDLEPAIPDGEPFTSADAWAAIENMAEPEGTPVFLDAAAAANDPDEAAIDDSVRFLTYRNYAGAIAMIIREIYGESPFHALADATRSLSGVKRIQRRKLDDGERKRASRELRGAWAYEISMSLPSEQFARDVPDLVMIANHTAGVFAHYAIYKAARALSIALHMEPADQHEEHLDRIDGQLIRRDLLPAPWTARCGKGGAPRSKRKVEHVFMDFPEGTSRAGNLWRPDPQTMWGITATALKTTRDRSREFENRLKRWRYDHRSKRSKNAKPPLRQRAVPYEVQDELYGGMRPTNMLDFVYRLRRRSSYEDDSSFLNNEIGITDALAFNQDLLLITRSTLHVLETLIEAAAADDFLIRAQERFSQRTNAGLLAWTFAGRSRDEAAH